MLRLKRKYSLFAPFLALFLACGPLAAAVSFPERPLDLSVVHSPGGALDIASRALALEAGKELGHNVVVRNTPGGGGVPGVARMAQSPADGHNLAAAVSNALIFLPWRNKAPYRPLRDIEPVLAFGQAAPMLIGPAKGRWSHIDEFLQETRENPGGLRVGVPGLGTPSHIALAMLSQEDPTLSWRFIPYAGPGEAEAALLGGHIDAAASGALPRIRGGQFQPLLVLGSFRLPALPDLPSLSDMGFHDPGQGDSMFLILAPASTPEDVLQKLETAFIAAARSEAFARAVEGFSVSPVIMGRAETKAWLREVWGKEADVLRLMGLPPEAATRLE